MNRLEKVVDWTALAREAHFSSKELAKACSISPRQLRRYFAHAFEKAPQDWLDELRLSDAVSLLLAGHSVKAAALELHFKNTAHLSHRFKELHGYSPSEFVRRAWAIANGGGGAPTITGSLPSAPRLRLLNASVMPR